MNRPMNTSTGCFSRTQKLPFASVERLLVLICPPPAKSALAFPPMHPPTRVLAHLAAGQSRYVPPSCCRDDGAQAGYNEGGGYNAIAGQRIVADFDEYAHAGEEGQRQHGANSWANGGGEEDGYDGVGTYEDEEFRNGGYV